MGRRLVTEGITSEQINDAISFLSRELDEKREGQARLNSDIQRSERELALLLELARVRGVSTSSEPTGVLDIRNESADGARSSLADVVVAILRRRSQPMHIQELLRTVRDAGVAIPGKGEPANLIAHIRTHTEIVRPVRGMYGLREWGLVDGVPVTMRSRRRKRRPRSKAKH